MSRSLPLPVPYSHISLLLQGLLCLSTATPHNADLYSELSSVSRLTMQLFEGHKEQTGHTKYVIVSGSLEVHFKIFQKSRGNI